VVRHRSAIANWSSVTRGAGEAGRRAPGKQRAHQERLDRSDTPGDSNTVNSKAIGHNASVELSGFPPTFSGQSRPRA
jgi:hypothetical protein